MPPPIDPQTKNIFLSYACRIQCITFIHDASVDLMKWLFTFGSPTFPAITHLVWGVHAVPFLSLCRPLITPTLKSLLVKFQIRRHEGMLAELSSIVALLLQLAGNNLTHFVIHHEDSEFSDEAGLLEVTNSLTHGFSSMPLVRLFATTGIPIRAAILTMLSTASNLRELRVLLADDVQTLAPGSNVFPQMMKLVLKGSTRTCTALIASLSTPSRIEHLRITLVDKTIPIVILELAQTIRLALGDPLRTLQLRSPTGFQSNILPPLFKCHRLESVDVPIDLGASESLSDIKVQARRAWPDITSLVLEL